LPLRGTTRAKEAKTREFLEKLFPEVRKQREQQERIDRHGTRGDACRSEADFAEIVDGLSEQVQRVRLTCPRNQGVNSFVIPTYSQILSLLALTLSLC